MDEINIGKKSEAFPERMTYHDYDWALSRIRQAHDWFVGDMLTCSEYVQVIRCALHQIRDCESLTDGQTNRLVDSAANAPDKANEVLLKYFTCYKDSDFAPFDYFGNHFSVEEQIRRKPFIARTSSLLICRLLSRSGVTDE